MLISHYYYTKRDVKGLVFDTEAKRFRRFCVSKNKLLKRGVDSQGTYVTAKGSVPGDIHFWLSPEVSYPFIDIKNKARDLLLLKFKEDNTMPLDFKAFVI